jgi:ABC-type branched-subunit amino acid transport system substrate-binding protein
MPTSAPTTPKRGVALWFALAATGAMALAGCTSSGLGFLSSPDVGAAPVPQVQSQPLNGPPAGPTVGETVGTGPVRVGLILPLTQNNAPSPIGVSMHNGAQLAIEESGMNDVTLMIVDDHGTPDGAAQAAQAVIGAGAEIILGPLLAADVREVGRIAKPAGRPVIAFSTDEGVAQPGVYLLSFLIESYSDRIAEYAFSKGKKTFAILAPQSDYGNIAVGEFQQAATKLGARVVTVARYTAGQPQTGVQELASAPGGFDAVFVAEQADGMPALAQALAGSGLKTQILGTGVWNDPRVLRLPALQGAWFAAPDDAGYNAFAQRYKTRFNSDPLRLATLAYDAASLTAALARTQGAQRFSTATLTNPSGFNGIDGVFRFTPDGPNERGLAVKQISAGTASTIAPAPPRFPGS